MNGDLLRRAANLLRASVDGITPAPWQAEDTQVYGTGHVTKPANEWVQPGQRYWVGEMLHGAECVCGKPDNDCECEPTGGDIEAAYIALMHPPVALALADWLDATATGIADAGSAVAAVATARAILRLLPDWESELLERETP